MNDGGGYELRGSAELEAAPEAVMTWLTEPERLERWVAGVSVEAVDDGAVRVLLSHGAHGSWTFTGEVLERGERRLVRRYRLEQTHAGVLPFGAAEGDYERTVTFELEPVTAGRTLLTVTAGVAIPGLGDRASRAGGRAEQKGLERSLKRLGDEIEGRRPGLLSRLAGSSSTPGPL